MKNNKITIGQKVYLFDGTELTVSKVGKKYFHTNSSGYRERKFVIEELYEIKDYGKFEKVFLSKEDLGNEKLRITLSNTLENQFGQYGQKRNLSLDQLKRIVNILNEEIDERRI